MEDHCKTGEIILASTEDIVLHGESCQPHWKQVVYNLAVYLLKAGGALGGEQVRADHVFGRAMGERSDEKTFFATAILPWIWTDPQYDWRRIVRERLDSFLEPRCQCDAREEDTKVCDWHLDLIAHWDSVDREDLGLYEARKLPVSISGAGVYPSTKEMHRDYPWAREAKDGRYICTICGYGREPREARYNPTYKNIFIRDHSHCGFGNPDDYAPKAKTDAKALPAESEMTIEAVEE